MSERTFDVVVLGSGTAGREAAGRLAQARPFGGIVEPELVGGECVFYACMPSKSLLRPERGADRGEAHPGSGRGRHRPARRAPPSSPAATRSSTTFEDSSYLPGFESQGIELVRGHGRLDGERRVASADDL